jgi:hypothetical protein
MSWTVYFVAVSALSLLAVEFALWFRAFAGERRPGPRTLSPRGGALKKDPGKVGKGRRVSQALSRSMAASALCLAAIALAWLSDASQARLGIPALLLLLGAFALLSFFGAAFAKRHELSLKRTSIMGGKDGEEG